MQLDGTAETKVVSLVYQFLLFSTSLHFVLFLAVSSEWLLFGESTWLVRTVGSKGLLCTDEDW